MSKHKPVAVALGTALAGLTLSGTAFAMQPLAQGYMLATSDPAQAATTAEGKCGEGKCGIAHVDTDKDGRISRAEFEAAHPHAAERFEAIDTNQDGYIDQDEHAAHHAANHSAKAAEGKCGEHKTDKDAEAKASEGKCGAEGKCGEGKCGGMA